LKTGSKEITSVRQRRWHNWPETKVKQASKLADRHPWMGILKCWLQSTIDLAMVELQSAAQDGRVSVHLNPKDFAAFFMLAKVQFRETIASAASVVRWFGVAGAMWLAA
jgi:hypothetical protein